MIEEHNSQGSIGQTRATSSNEDTTAFSEESQIEQAQKLIDRIRQEIGRVFVGQENVVDQVLITLIANGHVLLEGVPGLGKTLLVRALATCFSGEYARVQFTPDLMPSDIVGHALFNMAKQEFEIRKGPIFTNLLLADEINRAPAKTQAALLEVMQEKQITIEGESFSAPAPFMVLATQNPVEQEGTYPLPEAELDRFMMKVIIDYPTHAEENAILEMLTRQTSQAGFSLGEVKKCLKPSHIQSLQKIAASLTVDSSVINYITEAVRASRSWQGISRGAGPRASIALLAAGRARALINGESFVSPDDIKAVFLPILRHRIELSAELEIEGINSDEILQSLLQSIAVPRQ